MISTGRSFSTRGERRGMGEPLGKKGKGLPLRVFYPLFG
jgi:hypothetical protein